MGLYPEVGGIFMHFVVLCRCDGSADTVSAKGSPPYDNNFCKADAQETELKGRTAHAVPVPEYDPIFGINGPLTTLWTKPG